MNKIAPTGVYSINSGVNNTPAAPPCGGAQQSWGRRRQAKNLALSWDVEPVLSSKRTRKVKTFFDELTKDTEFTDPLYSFKVKVFIKSLDVLTFQLKNWFQGLKTISENFKFLTPKFLVEKTDNELMDCARLFCEKYDDDVTNALVSQIVCFKNVASKEIKDRDMQKVVDVARFLLIEHPSLSSSLPDVCTALMMYLTLPVTSAAAER